MFFFIGHIEVFQSNNAPASLQRAAKLRSVALWKISAATLTSVGIILTIVGTIMTLTTIFKASNGITVSSLVLDIVVIALGAFAIAGGVMLMDTVDKIVQQQIDIISGTYRESYVTSHDRSFELAFTPNARAFMFQGSAEGNETYRRLSNLVFEQEIIDADRAIASETDSLSSEGDSFEAEFTLIHEIKIALASADPVLQTQLEARRVILTRDFDEWTEDGEDLLELYRKRIAILNL